MTEHGTGARVYWYDVPMSRARMIKDLADHPDIIAPLNENGQICPWPWDPPQLAGQPIGQYHCPYCGAMCLAGMVHPDYRDLDEDYQRYMEAHGGREDQPVSQLWSGDSDHDSPQPGVVLRDLPEGTAREDGGGG